MNTSGEHVLNMSIKLINHLKKPFQEDKGWVKHYITLHSLI